MEQQTYVGVIVKHKNKCLLCKRNNKGSYPGMWSIPAGKLEKEEDTLVGAKREFFEETNIDIENEDLKFSGIVPRHTRDGKKVKGRMYTYCFEPNESIQPDLENAKDGEEHSECKYFSSDELDEMSTGTYLYKLLKIILEKN
jgi:ADP-ribose pyrophosphatase YjhB (NUDIX family)